MFKWINLIFYLAMVAANGLSTFGKLNGITTEAVSKEYASLITPVGWTFAIWGVIYVLLLIFVIAPFVKPQGKIAVAGKNLAVLFPISCVLNIAWIICWHWRQILLSWITMIALFLVLYMMFDKLTKNSNALAGAGISAYFGWICVAMLANTMAMAVALRLDGFNTIANVMTCALLCIGMVLIAWISVTSTNIIFAVAGIWGFAGIAFRHLAPTELNSQYLSVSIISVAGIVVIALALLISLLNKNVKISQMKS